MTGLIIDGRYFFNIGLLESEGWVKVGSCILYDIFIFLHAKVLDIRVAVGTGSYPHMFWG